MKNNAASSVTGVSSGAELLEIGNQFGERFGIHDRAGELVRAYFSSFFQNVDIFGGELRPIAAPPDSLCFLMRLARCSAQERPAGPAPTMRTSASSCSRCTVITSF